MIFIGSRLSHANVTLSANNENVPLVPLNSFYKARTSQSNECGDCRRSGLFVVRSCLFISSQLRPNRESQTGELNTNATFD